MKQACQQIKREPVLLAVPESVQNDFKASDIIANEARAHISCRGFWRNQRSFFYVKVTNLLTLNFGNHAPNATLTTAEKGKKRKYNKRVMEVDHGTFTLFTQICWTRIIDFLWKINSQYLRKDERPQIDNDNDNVNSTKNYLSLLRSATCALREDRHASPTFTANYLDCSESLDGCFAFDVVLDESSFDNIY